MKGKAFRQVKHIQKYIQRRIYYEKEASYKKILLTGALARLGTNAIAVITVNKSNGVLKITPDINGTVIAKVVGPDDEVMADESYSGSSLENKRWFCRVQTRLGVKGV